MKGSGKILVPMPDGGPVYTETNLEQFIVEPFNTLSAFLFLLVAGFWYLKLRGQFSKYKFLTAATTILTIGAVGGTVYHAFRSDAFFMFMDWVPIVLLCWAASIYFIFRLTQSYWWASGAFVFSILAQVIIFQLIPGESSTNLSYATMAFAVVVPTIWNIVKTKFYHWWWVMYAFAAFILALMFRILDPLELLPIGTHFLWHLFGVGAGYFMFKYIYKIQKRDLSVLSPTEIRA